MPHFNRAVVQENRLRKAWYFLISILASLGRSMPVEERARIVAAELFDPLCYPSDLSMNVRGERRIQIRHGSCACVALRWRSG
jgi:hypothetical protein